MAIRYRNGAYEVTVNIGIDPHTRKRRQVSRTLRMAEQKRIPAEVKALEARLIGEVRAGKHSGVSITVAELLDAYLAHRTVKALSPTTRRGYEGSVRLHLKPGLGAVRVAKLTTADLDRLYHRLERQGLAPATIRQAHIIMRRALRLAQRWGYVDANVATLAELPNLRPRQVRAATADHLARLLTAAADPDLADFVALAATTGARRGELCGLRWSDLDLDDGAAEIARSLVEVDRAVTVKVPKSGRTRRIALGPGTVARLRGRRERLEARAERFGVTLAPDAYVLSDDVEGVEPWPPSVATGRFRALAKRAGVPAHLHMLRHYAATVALATTGDVNAVAAHLGHVSAKMTLDVYGHALPEGMRKVGDALDV